jgi:hypothetical protein
MSNTPDLPSSSSENLSSSAELPEISTELENLSSSIIQGIGAEEDKYKKSDADIQELSQHLEKKEYVKAIYTALKMLFTSFSLKSTNGFSHLDKYIQQLQLNGKNQTEILHLIKDFSEKLEKSDFSISDSTDIAFLYSACKDRWFQRECQIKQQSEPTAYDSLLYNLHHDFSNL